MVSCITLLLSVWCYMFFNVLFLMVLYGFMWSYLVSSWFSMGLLRASLSNLNGGFRGFSEVAVRAGKPTKNDLTSP